MHLFRGMPVLAMAAVVVAGWLSTTGPAAAQLVDRPGIEDLLARLIGEAGRAGPRLDAMVNELMQAREVRRHLDTSHERLLRALATTDPAARLPLARDARLGLKNTRIVAGRIDDQVPSDFEDEVARADAALTSVVDAIERGLSEPRVRAAGGTAARHLGTVQALVAQLNAAKEARLNNAIANYQHFVQRAAENLNKINQAAESAARTAAGMPAN